MTNGEMLKALFPKLEPIVLSNETGAIYFDWEWWESSYTESTKDKEK